MTALEERIRRGLAADLPVSVDDLISAAAAGAQRSRTRQRWTAGAVAVGATLATAAAIAVATQHGGSRPQPPPQPAGSTEPTKVPSSPPSASDWPLELGTDGSSVYLLTRSCPGALRKGTCETAGGYGESGFITGDEQDAASVSLWRYDGETWSELGKVPTVSTSANLTGEGSGWPMRPGLLRVGPSAVVLPGSGLAALEVSTDQGRTWGRWSLPWQPDDCFSFGYDQCNFVVTGNYVVAASGTTWWRRSVDSADWEDVTPPERARYNEADDGRYGLLALDDGTLIATADDMQTLTGTYRVSKDSGSTWSDPRPNPGGNSQFDDLAGVSGSTLYATCWTSEAQCGFYRTTDLVHWTLVTVDQGPVTLAGGDGTCPGPGWAENESVVRVGSLTYAIAHVPYLDGHPAERGELPDLDHPHDVRHVLQVSDDDCRTWEPVLP